MRTTSITTCLIWLTLALLFVAPVAAEPRKNERFPTKPKAVIIRFTGKITPKLERYLFRKLNDAQSRGVNVVILEIHSPGGYVDSSFRICDRLVQLDWAYTIAFIPEEALSGAAFVALACDEIVMPELGRLGDAGPIVQTPDGRILPAAAKIQTHIAVRIRDIAEAKGRAPALAEAMVDQKLNVFEVKNTKTGKVTYMSKKELDKRVDAKDWTIGRPVMNQENRFLEVNGKTAKTLGLAQVIAGTRDKLRLHYDLQGPLRVVEPNWIDGTVDVLTSPVITVLLLIVGMIALYVELSAPGVGVGGLISGLCFSLFFWSRFLGGTAGWLEVILFVSGFVFLAMEIFVIPGFGIAGVTGGLLILGSIIMASQTFVIPSTEYEVGVFRNSLFTVLVSGVGFVIGAVIVSRYFGNIPVLNKLVLGPPPSDEELDQRAAQSKEKSVAVGSTDYVVQIGDWGEAESPLRPAGKAIFADEYIDVVTDGGFVDAGVQVRVVDISGNRIVVRKVDDVG